MQVEPNWKPRPAQIPESPGVYLFRDARGRVLYAGKAKVLRQRLASYFTTGLGPRTAAMVEEARGVEWIVTGGEVEALQLEVSLIKQHRPRYNVRYRDDKSYPYLAVTLNEEVPRAMVTRGRRRKGVRYYGPFAHAYAIRETLDLLLRVFPLRSCSQGVFDRAARSNRPCLLYHIGRCSGPCVGAVSRDEHDAIVRRFCAFLDGGHSEVIADLKERMEAAAGTLEFEHAARLRDQLGAIRKVIERQQMVTERPENFDVVGYHGDELEASFQVFFVRAGRVVGRKGFIVDRVEELTEAGLMESFLESVYSDLDDVPREILVPVLPERADLVTEWLQTRRDGADGATRPGRTRLRVPERGAKRRLMETVAENAREAFMQNRLKRASDFAARTRALNALKEHLNLPEAPLRIECFDVSNLGPTEVVGSMVVFEDGLPKKSGYRKFKIRTVAGQDDVASMGELIRRRFGRFLEEREAPLEKSSRFSYEPSLVVIDGGRGQLNRAVDVMSELGVVGVPVVALAKRFEEVHLPGEREPVVVPRGSEALYLLQRVRDEAHRFAVGYQRVRRTKKMTESLLDRLPGVGPARKRALIRHFGSTRRLLLAGQDDIAAVPGIGRQLAGRIHESLHA